MPTKVEKDSVTGLETTGHEWDGHEGAEHAAAELVAVRLLRLHRLSPSVYWVLYPAIPAMSGYTPGLLG